MLNNLQERGIGLRAVSVALVAVLAMTLACVLVAPATAFALDTEKCSARPNAEAGNDVLGGTETRITWEGRSGADEQVAGITLALPSGTEFSTDNARVTVLTGRRSHDAQPRDRRLLLGGRLVQGGLFRAC